MSIPHSRHQTPDKNRMRIDPAAAVAGALPFPSRREGREIMRRLFRFPRLYGVSGPGPPAVR